jgi:type II secretory pathway component PulM
MKAWKAKIMAWHRAHSPREQWLIILMVMLVVFAAAYQGVWRPVQRSLDEAQHAYAEEQELLQWIENRKAPAKRTATPAADADKPLSDLLKETAKTQGLTIKRLDVEKDGACSLTLEAVPFNDLIGWIGDTLESVHRVTLISAAITKTSETGLVNAKLKVNR